MLGRPDLAVHGPMALAIYERTEHLPGIAVVTGNMGVQAYAEGRWDDAVEHYRRAQDAFQRSGNGAQAALAEANIVEVLISQGHLDRAEPLARHAVGAMRAHNLVDQLFFAEVQLGRLLLARGDVDGAIELLARVLAEATVVGRSASALEAAIHLAAAHAERGRAAAALEILDDAERAAGDAAQMFRAPLCRVRAGALAATGRVEEASVEIVAGLAAAREQAQPYEEALLLRAGCAVAALAGGTPDGATLQEAEAILQRLGVVSG